MSRVCFYLWMFICSYGWAQLDSNQTFIVPTGPSQSLEEESSNSRRYTVRPLPPKNKTPINKEKDSAGESVPVPAPGPAPTPAPIPVPVHSPLLNNSDEVQNAILKDTRAATFRRPSFVEIQLAPGLIYTDSKSNYWYRDYRSTSPGLNANASLWISPTFGFKFSFISSLGGDVSTGPTDLSKTAVSQQWVNYGIQFRNWKDQSNTNTELEFGVKYSEFEFQPPLDSANRARLKTSGVSLFMQAKFRQTAIRKSFVEFEVMPKAIHKEVPTALILHSGDKVDSSQIGIKFGNIYSLYESNSIFWSLNSSLEKNVFKGIASPTDPATNQALDGVTVYNRSVMFFIGYQWGD